MDNEMRLLLEEEKNYQNIGVGKILKGTIILERKEEFYVDLNYKTDGILPKSEVIEDENLSVGSEVLLKVLKIDGNLGEVIVSQKKAEEANVWTKLEIGKVIEVKVSEKNDKGIIAEYRDSVRGFIPLSHVSTKNSSEFNFNDFKGKKIKVEIIDVVPSKKRLVLSIKNVEIKKENEIIAGFINNIEVGQILNGTIKDLKDFGLIVQVGPMSGLVHKSEVSYDRNLNLAKSFKKGDSVVVQVLDFDKDTKKLSLSMKAMQVNPWNEFVETYEVGATLKGIVRNVKDFGAFVNLMSGIDGFVHISNLSYEFVKSAKDIVKIGDEVMVKIIGIDAESKKIELSMNVN